MGIEMRLNGGFGTIRLKSHMLIFFCLVIYFGCATEKSIPLEGGKHVGPKMTLEMGIDKLAREVFQSLPLEKRPRIAVVDLLGPHDNHTQLGSFISEKLITKLFISGRFEKVLERRLLRHLLMQQKVEMEGYFDQDTVKSICGKIGMDAMVMGFISDCGSRVDVNVRLINTKGEILSVAEAQIDKDRVVHTMLQGVKKAILKVAIDPSHVEASVAVGEQAMRASDGIAIFRDLPQGNRSIIVTGRGYETVQESIYLNDDRSITVPLIPKKVTVTLRIDPPGAEILFDGEHRGRASAGTMVLRDVLVGKHTILARAEGCLPETRAIELYEDRAISVKLPSDPLTQIADLKQHKPSFNIEIWTDKKRYRVGEEIRFYFRSDRDCYLTLIDYETNGNVKVLFPNRYYRDNFIRGSKIYVIPGREYGFKLTIEPPSGIERLKAIATAEALSLFDLDFGKNFFPPVERSNTRGMRSISIALDRLPNFSWAENSCTISIR
jgi:hypothetical protein